MEYNEKDFPKRIYDVLWNGNLMMLLRLNPDKLKISDVDKVGMPYAHIRMLDCKRGEEWKLTDYQKEIDSCLSDKFKFGYSLLTKEYIAKTLNKEHEFRATFILDERKAIAVSKATWERKNPTGKAYDVVSYWDDCDRKVVNPKPLLYSEACKLCEKYLSTRPSGSLYYYAVEVHKTN
jgi:hypothetical protein